MFPSHDQEVTDKKKFPDGRQPEFANMSRMPGIGYFAVDKFATAIRKKRLLPIRAFSLNERLIIRNNFLLEGMKEWTGIYYVESEHFRLNKLFLRKVVGIAYPEIMQFIKINMSGTPTAKELKEIKIYNNRLTDHSVLDKIKFETEDLHELQKKTATKDRDWETIVIYLYFF